MTNYEFSKLVLTKYFDASFNELLCTRIASWYTTVNNWISGVMIAFGMIGSFAGVAILSENAFDSSTRDIINWTVTISSVLITVGTSLQLFLSPSSIANTHAGLIGRWAELRGDFESLGNRLHNLPKVNEAALVEYQRLSDKLKMIESTEPPLGKQWDPVAKDCYREIFARMYGEGVTDHIKAAEIERTNPDLWRQIHFGANREIEVPKAG